MTTPQIIILVIVIFLIISIVGGIFVPPYFIAKKVYKKQLVRTDKEKWGRACSAPDNAEQVAMYAAGEAWAAEHMQYAKDVEITNEGLHLVGQYFDFGFDRCVIILQGRTESYLYSHYFAAPYKPLGFNVLVIDSRAHGLSDGIYNCVGLKEYSDILAWSRLMHDTYNNKSILLHGICIGSATAMNAITCKDTLPYFSGLIVEGMYTTFKETFYTHMKYEKKPTFPFVIYIMHMLKKNAGCNPSTEGPIKWIKKLDKPLLMLHSRQDIFSLPAKADELYAACPSKKKLVWFDKGAHSHIRINNTERYDQEIVDFVKEFINE